jgi:signal transduction histidine kinase
VNDSHDGLTRQERYLRTQFLRSLAHAIRSPLSVASGALDEIAATPKEQQEFLLQFARRNVRRLAVLADALSRVAELEGGTLIPSLGECDVSLVVRQAVASSTQERPPSRRPQAAVKVAIGEERLVADADPRLLAIVLGEVIGRGVSATGTPKKRPGRTESGAC